MKLLTIVATLAVATNLNAAVGSSTASSTMVNDLSASVGKASTNASNSVAPSFTFSGQKIDMSAQASLNASDAVITFSGDYIIKPIYNNSILPSYRLIKKASTNVSTSLKASGAASVNSVEGSAQSVSNTAKGMWVSSSKDTSAEGTSFVVSFQNSKNSTSDVLESVTISVVKEPSRLADDTSMAVSELRSIQWSGEQLEDLAIALRNSATATLKFSRGISTETGEFSGGISTATMTFSTHTSDASASSLGSQDRKVKH